MLQDIGIGQEYLYHTPKIQEAKANLQMESWQTQDTSRQQRKQSAE